MPQECPPFLPATTFPWGPIPDGYDAQCVVNKRALTDARILLLIAETNAAVCESCWDGDKFDASCAYAKMEAFWDAFNNLMEQHWQSMEECKQ